MGGNTRTNPNKWLTQTLVVSYVSCPVESMSVMYFFVLSIINWIISMLDTAAAAEIPEQTLKLFDEGCSQFSVVSYVLYLSL